jgi:hypothetical protein
LGPKSEAHAEKLLLSEPAGRHKSDVRVAEWNADTVEVGPGRLGARLQGGLCRLCERAGIQPGAGARERGRNIGNRGGGDNAQLVNLNTTLCRSRWAVSDLCQARPVFSLVVKIGDFAWTHYAGYHENGESRGLRADRMFFSYFRRSKEIKIAIFVIAIIRLGMCAI